MSQDGTKYTPFGYQGPQVVETPVVGQAILLSMEHQFVGVFRGTNILEQGGNHGIFIAPLDSAFAAYCTFFVEIEAGAEVSFDPNHRFSDPRVSSMNVFTALETGWYKMTFTWTGAHWLTEISQSVYV